MLQLLLKVCKSQNLVWNKMNSPPRIPDFRRPKINLLNFTITKFLFRVNFLIFLMKWKLKTTKNCKTMTFSRFFVLFGICWFFSWNHSWKRPNIAKPLQFSRFFFPSFLFEFFSWNQKCLRRCNEAKELQEFGLIPYVLSHLFNSIWWFFSYFSSFFSMWW